MPLKEINYDKTHFYKLMCKDFNITDCYVGHTTDWVKSCRKFRGFTRNWGEWKEDSPKMVDSSNKKWWIHSKNSMSGLVDSWESSPESMVKLATNRCHLQFCDGWSIYSNI